MIVSCSSNLIYSQSIWVKYDVLQSSCCVLQQIFLSTPDSSSTEFVGSPTALRSVSGFFYTLSFLFVVVIDPVLTCLLSLIRLRFLRALPVIYSGLIKGFFFKSFFFRDIYIHLSVHVIKTIKTINNAINLWL